MSWRATFIYALLFALCTMPARAASVIGIESKNIRVEFDSLMHSRIVAKFDGKATPVGDFGPSEFVTAAASPIQDFKLSGHKLENVRDELGHGRRLSITGISGGLQKTVVVTVYDEIPRMAFFQVHYLNQSDEALRVTGWTNNRYSITAAGSDEPAFWSYQSGSYRNRPDWVLPLKVNFKQENFLGMNATDYGGGTPVADVWRRDIGIAVGHLEHAPKLVSLPVTMPDATHASLALTFSTNTVLKPGRNARHIRQLRRGTSAGLLSELPGLQRSDATAGLQVQSRARERFRPHLVRLGIWKDVHPVTGGTSPAGSQEAGFCMGRRG